MEKKDTTFFSFFFHRRAIIVLILIFIMGVIFLAIDAPSFPKTYAENYGSVTRGDPSSMFKTMICYIDYISKNNWGYVWFMIIMIADILFDYTRSYPNKIAYRRWGYFFLACAVVWPLLHSLFYFRYFTELYPDLEGASLFSIMVRYAERCFMSLSFFLFAIIVIVWNKHKEINKKRDR